MSRRTHLLVAASAAALLLATACSARGPAVRTAQHVGGPDTGAPSGAVGTSLGQQLGDAAESIDRALAAAGAGDMDRARKEYEIFDDAWEDEIEDGVRTQARDIYRVVEGTMDEVRDVLIKVTPPDRDGSIASLAKLRQVVDEQRPRLGP